MAVTTAGMTDHKRMLQALKHGKPCLNLVQSLLADSGYAGEPFAQVVDDGCRKHDTDR